MIGAAAGGALVASLALGSMPAMAGDDGSGSILSGFMDILGANPKSEPPHISYVERPPLVVPPHMDLPKPERPVALGNPNWPHDPDARTSNGKANWFTHPYSLERDSRGSSQAELQAHRLAPGTPSRAGGYNPCDFNASSNACTMAKWSDLKPSKTKVPDQLTAGQEPPREDLTDPPAGYRVATKNVKATQAAPVIEDNSPLAFVKQQNGQ